MGFLLFDVKKIGRLLQEENLEHLDLKSYLKVTILDNDFGVIADQICQLCNKKNSFVEDSFVTMINDIFEQFISHASLAESYKKI